MQYMNKHFENVIHEYIDITDKETRDFIFSLNEAGQNKVLMSLTSKLYEYITKRITDIDFGTIPDSKGDITKIEGYDNLLDCLNVLKATLVEYKQDTEPVNEILEAIDNLYKRKDKFELAFKIKMELPILIYSTITMAVVSSTSLLITSAIEYIKIPGSDDFKITLDKVGLNRTRNNLLFQNIKRFNVACKKGDIDQVIDSVLKSGSSKFTGVDTAGIMSLVVIGALALSIMPILRELIYFFYYSRVKIADYLEIQADLLQMNVYNVQRNADMIQKDKEEIIHKQSRIISIFRSLANKISIKNKTAEQKTKTDVELDNKKVTMTSHKFDTNSPLF